MGDYAVTVIFYADDETMNEGLAFVTAELEKAGAQITKQDNLGVKTLA